MEREKKSVVVEKMYILKKQPELNELRQTVLLFFYYLIIIYLFSTRLFQIRTCVLCVQVAMPLLLTRHEIKKLLWENS